MKDFFRLLRVGDLLVIALAQLLAYLGFVEPIIASTGLPFHLPVWQLAALIVATTFIAASGFVVNDYFDIKIDRINRPDRVIVSNSISKPDAMHIYQIFTIAGVAIGVVAAVFLKSLTIAFIYIVVAGLMWFYSSSYKRMLIVGNLIVSVSAALVPIIPAFAAKELLVEKYEEIILELPIVSGVYTACCALALLIFIFVFVLELLKDIRDAEGDREMECHTIPVVWGEKAARIIATVLIVIGSGLMLFASFNTGLLHDTLSFRYGLCLLVPAAFLIYFVWARGLTALRNGIYVNKLLLILLVLYPLIYRYILC